MGGVRSACLRRAAVLPAALACAGLAAAVLAAPASASLAELPFLGAFGPVAQPEFGVGQPVGLAVDSGSGDLLAFESQGVEEHQELTIEAAAGLGGTYQLSFEGQSTGWTGEAHLVGGETAVTAMHTSSGALVDGEQVSGTGIQPGTTVSAVSEGAGTFTLSQPATSTGTFADLGAALPATASGAVIKAALTRFPAVGANGLEVEGGGAASPVRRKIRFWGPVARLYQRDVPLLGCDGSSLTGTSPTCTVAETQKGLSPGIYRFHEDGTPAPFAALGTNLIDGRDGAGARPCGEEASSCDLTPQGKLGNIFGHGFLAIDESGTATDGDIYIALNEQQAVDVFAPDGHYLGRLTKYRQGAEEKLIGAVQGVAVGPTGSVYVTSPEGEKILEYSPQGAPHNPLGNADSAAVFPDAARPAAVAAGAGPTAGSIFIYDNKNGTVQKRDAASGAVQYQVGTGIGSVLAVSPATGRLFAGGQTAVGSSPTVTEYDASGALAATPLAQAALKTPGSNAIGIAPNGASGDLYVAEQGDSPEPHIRTYAPSQKPTALSKPASSLAATAATLNGTANPNGVPLDACSFEWGTSASPYAHSEPCAESAGEIGSGEAPVPVHLDLSGLAPGTTYHFRLVASNPAGASEGSDLTFHTPRPPLVSEEAALSATSSEALLQAKVNPEGFPATYRVQYGTTSAYGQSTPARSLAAADTSPHTVSVALEGLAPATTYHWRILADNTDPSFPGTGTETGEDRTFTTFPAFAPDTACPNQAFRTGLSAPLPDCRAYELVSPLDKEGGDVISQLEAAGYPAVLSQSSASGDRMAYGAYRAFGDAKAAPRTSQYIAERTETGWRSHYILGPRGRLDEVVPPSYATELRALSPDLCQAWVRTYAEPKLAPGAVTGEMNLYRRRDEAEGCGGESWEALTTATPPHGFGALGFDLQGTSADGSAAIYVATDNLTPDAPELVGGGDERSALYYQAEGEGQPHFACVLPNGSPIGGSCSAGGYDPTHIGGITRNARLTGALSADGSRVFWTTPVSSSGKIYVRENPAAPEASAKDPEGDCEPEAGKACTIAVSKGGEALQGSSSSQFWAASQDGSKALYSTGEGLYLFDVDTQTTTPVAEEVLGVAGESADLSRVYFGSKEAIAGVQPNSEGDAPLPGGVNLYLYEAGAPTRFVATLDGSAELAPRPVTRSARATPDGRHLVFVSNAPLTGYDNADAATGEADSEVFRYDASAREGKGGLLCASCNPSGARPAGRLVHANATDFPVAAMVPVWKSNLYAGRVMSDDGSRIFFESPDALTPRDSNGSNDVYEWEAPGSGSCSASSSGYSAQDEGCVSLISSGQSPGKVELLDSSPSGNDVFFTTAASLLPADYGLIDVYDARVGGGLPEPAPPAPGCEGEACQGAAGAPPYESGASLRYAGPGNQAGGGSGARRCPKGKRRSNRNGKTRCVARHRRHHRHHHRRRHR